MYAATRLSITDPLSVILGARISDYSSTTVSTAEGAQQSTTKRYRHALPGGGV